MSTKFLNTLLFQTSSLEHQDLPLADELAATTLLEYQDFTLIAQCHIQSEQKRCAEIKDAFEKLHRQLPTTYTGRKMSKAVLLQKDLTTIIANSLCKAVSHIKNQLRKMSFLLDEFNHLNQTCVYLNEELEKKKK
ncbi:33507_t:CDS:2 [Gigaspora margarita]|uniref:33507_t:CDS:1 n=1 Tax=Gigaspora margarita TaxID=4874 RepID=A0ABN7UC69_GIGMA|nr:33507_t:CDS:2 [Gigaspora margarita]